MTSPYFLTKDSQENVGPKGKSPKGKSREGQRKVRPLTFSRKFQDATLLSVYASVIGGKGRQGKVKGKSRESQTLSLDLPSRESESPSQEKQRSWTFAHFASREKQGKSTESQTLALDFISRESQGNLKGKSIVKIRDCVDCSYSSQVPWWADLIFPSN